MDWISSRIPEGTFRPPGNLILRLLLCHFRHETRWCFAVSAVFGKRCLVAAFLLIYRQQQQSKLEIKIGQNWISSRIPEGTFRPPGNLILRLLLCHFRHEIRWRFAVSAVLRKRCLAAAFLLIYRQQQQSKLEIKIGQNWISSRIPEGTFRPPGNLILRLLLCHFRHEIRWCFAVSAVLRKRCLAAGFLL